MDLAPSIACGPPTIDHSYCLIPTSCQQGASHRPNGPTPYGSNDNQEGRRDTYTSGRSAAVEEEGRATNGGIIKEEGTAASGIFKGSDPFQDPAVGHSGSVDLRGGLGGHAAPARLRRTTSTGGGGSDGGGRSSGGGGAAAPAVGNAPRTFFTIGSNSRALGGGGAGGGGSVKGSAPVGVIWQKNAFASETADAAEGGVGDGGCPLHRSGPAAAVMRDASDSDEEGQQYMKYKQQMEEPLPGMAGEMHDGLSAMRPPPPRPPQRDGIQAMARNPSKQLAPMRSNRTDLQPRRE